VLLVQTLYQATERMDWCKRDQVTAHYSNRPMRSNRAGIKNMKQIMVHIGLYHIAAPQINPRYINLLPPQNNDGDFGPFRHCRNSTPPPSRIRATLPVPHPHPPPLRSTLIAATRGAEGRISINQARGPFEKRINRRRRGTSLPG
jgi:hypothetical protein